MRRSLVAVFAAILVLIVLLPALAQLSLPDVLQDNEDFSYLADAIAAATPEIDALLNSGDPYTLFAPTNDAFIEAAEFLGVTPEQLLSNRAILTQILLYHVVPERITSADFADRQRYATLLDGNLLVVNTTEDGTLRVNRMADVLEADIENGAGIIHAMDAVLLNSTIVRALAAAPSEPATPAAEVTETPAIGDTDAMDGEQALASTVTVPVRFAHLAADAPPVDLYIDEQLAGSGLAYTEFSNTVLLQDTTYAISVTATGASEPVLGPIDLEVREGVPLLVAVTGSLVDETLTATVFEENLHDISANATRILFFNALAGDVQLDVLGNDVNFARLNAGTDVILSVPTDSGLSFALRPVVAADQEAAAFEVAELDLQGGSYYVVGLAGNQSEPTLVVDAYDMDAPADASLLPRALQLEMAEASLLDEIATNDSLTTLNAVLAAVDDNIIALLGAGDLNTFFAPTDQAFRNLLATAGVSEASLLTQTQLLTDILRYHTLEGAVYADDVVELNGQSIPTALGDEVAIRVFISDSGSVVLNDVVTVMTTDIITNTGVLHIVDNVLLPQSALNALGL